VSVWDMHELKKLSKELLHCPTCIQGPIFRGYNQRYKPVIARVITDHVVAQDAQGIIKMTIFQRVIICKTHGQRLVEVQM